MLVMSARAGLFALVILLAGTIASPASIRFALEGHRSSLRATVTLIDGTRHRMTLEGVGCPQEMCSRVRLKDTQATTVWLDGLTSVTGISHNADGPVQAVFTFKDGSSRQVSVTALNRVLYVGVSWWTRQLDLTSVRRLDFDQ
jgi:hypothetical protein